MTASSLFTPSDHAATPSQADRLAERRVAEPHPVFVGGEEFIVDRGVYATSVDTELMAETVRLAPGDTFLEIGCGTGAVSILLARDGHRGVATDINPLAVQNARANAERLGVSTVSFLVGDGFAGIDDPFDVIICNPPYNNHEAQDTIDRMFWDPEDALKHAVFREVAAHLKPGGRLYFGWSNFADIDRDLPLRLGSAEGFVLRNVTERPSHSGRYAFYVLQFEPV